MKKKFLHKNYLLVLVLIIISLLIPVMLRTLHIIPHLSYTDVPDHSAIEAVGAVLSLLITLLIFIRFYRDKNEVDYPFVAVGFLGMGLFDLFHAFLPVGNTFVFSHIISLLTGGFWFALLALPPKVRKNARKPFVFKANILLWISVMLVMAFWPEKLPRMIVDGKFTPMTHFQNTVAAILFFIGIWQLLKRYRRKYEKEIFLIAVIALLQALSRITFPLSEVWDFNWWIWHVYRLLGSIVLFYSVWHIFKRMLDNLAKINKDQQTILDSMPFGLMVIGKDKRIKQFNKSAQELTGFANGEVAGETCFSTICGANCGTCGVLDLGKTINGDEKLIKKKNGEILPIIKTVVPITLNEEEVLLEGFVDITEMKKARQNLENTLKDLERSNKELEQFAYVASHDLQEPLRKMNNYADLLLKSYKNDLDEKGQKYVNVISSGAVRMQRLIDDLLGISRVSSNESVFKKVDLDTVVQNARKRIKERHIGRTFNISYEDLPSVYGNINQLTQLFYNLLSNAVKYNHNETAEIEINANREEGKWQFEIIDNGIGFEQKYAQKIFVIFQRLHSRENYSGTGVGLTYCKKVVEHHGGSIWADSEPDKGTKISFTIPTII
ncbi:MAG: ATP-binding protein [Draconibacterium sp.]|nr:ATP-binding protein [Draconibacterium sp.]